MNVRRKSTYTPRVTPATRVSNVIDTLAEQHGLVITDEGRKTIVNRVLLETPGHSRQDKILATLFTEREVFTKQDDVERIEERIQYAAARNPDLDGLKKSVYPNPARSR